MPRQRTRRWLMALGLAAWIGAPGLGPHPGRAQDPDTPAPLVFRYRDDEGPGRLTITPVEEAEGEGGPARIRVELGQGDVRLSGSGIAQAIEGQPPTTRYAFAVTGPQGSYFFHGATTSGITLSGQGRYHRLGAPEQEHAWSIVVGR